MELQRLLKNLLLVAWWGTVGALAAYGASTIYETKFLADADGVACPSDPGSIDTDDCSVSIYCRTEYFDGLLLTLETPGCQACRNSRNKRIREWKKEKREYERCSYLGENIVVREY